MTDAQPTTAPPAEPVGTTPAGTAPAGTAPGATGPGGPPEVAVPDEVIAEAPAEELRGESVDEPAKVMRIGSMIKQLLEEVRHAPLDDASRSRLKEIYETSVQELAAGSTPQELQRLRVRGRGGRVRRGAESGCPAPSPRWPRR